MKFTIFAFILAMIVAVVSGTICARDQRSGGPQNFASISAMRAENNRGGRKFGGEEFCLRRFNFGFSTGYTYQHDGAC
jgi:hypothetical protein